MDPTVVSDGAAPVEAGTSRRDLHMEDRILVDLGIRLFGVFDGVGAGAHGAEAASAAVNAVHDAVFESLKQARHPPSVRAAQELLAGALLRADEAIRTLNDQHEGVLSDATTAALVLMFRPQRLPAPDYLAVIATVGDSRVQLLRSGGFFTLTLDHSLLGDGELSDITDIAEAKARQDRLDEARSLDDLTAPLDRAAFNHRNLISSALDGSGHANARFYALRLVPGDRLLIDSDGVHDNLRASELAVLAQGLPSPRRTAARITTAAWEHSQQNPPSDGRVKPDDISIVVIDVGDDD
jgi:serine/threonine protein phosphatase PrpC